VVPGDRAVLLAIAAVEMRTARETNLERVFSRDIDAVDAAPHPDLFSVDPGRSSWRRM
jgi:hypothetical protein